ncbi:hypothetical protein [Croceicoccus bisphenolivorans]|uniref:hypothetical protein n=1 Tax=Croceicoccus bisphenolivorans TaxID=1783232 RepID=UPI00082E8C6C|nr:hypothetical protein [Croceicoccus bisphenolivorans]
MAYAQHLYLVETGPAIDPAVLRSTETLICKCLSAYYDGDDNALFELGCAFSTGSRGALCDLVEAHKWFNLAASRGHEEAQHCRADVAEEMTAREIVEAQRRARAFLAARDSDRHVA